MRLEEEIKQIKPFENEYHKATVNLIYTGKWIINLHNELFQSFNVTIPQYNILRILKGNHPTAVTVKYIKKRMLDKMSDASRIVDVMHKKGLVKRTLSTTDRRKVDVLLTQKGLDILIEVEKKNDELYGFLSNLDSAEIEQFNTLLDKVRG